MLNKNMKAKMKKTGIKTLTAIMLASTMMSAAAPVFAEEVEAEDFYEESYDDEYDDFSYEETEDYEDAWEEYEEEDTFEDASEEEYEEAETFEDASEEEYEEAETFEDTSEEEYEEAETFEDTSEENEEETFEETNEDNNEGPVEETEVPEEAPIEEEPVQEEAPAEEAPAEEAPMGVVSLVLNATNPQTDADLKQNQEADAVDTETVKLILKKELSDKEEAAKAKAAEQQKQKKINEAGAEAGKLAANIIKGKYNTAEAAVEDIGMTALKLINKTVIKEIPYIGGFASAILDGLTEKQQEDLTAKRLTTISEQLKTINKTIESCTDRIADLNVAIARDTKLEKINNAYADICKDYRNYMVDFNAAVAYMAKNNDGRSRDKELKLAAGKLDKIYTPYNRDFLENYISFCNKISSDAQLAAQDKELSPDVFSAFNSNVVRGKTGAHAEQEFAETKKMLIDNVKNTCGYGYDVLNTIIEADTVNQKTLKAGYEATIQELKAQLDGDLKDAPEEQKDAIQDAIDELELKLTDINSVLDALDTDQKLLNTTKCSVDKYVLDEIREDEKKAESFKNYKSGEKFELNGFEYDEEEFNGKTVYPTLNKEDNVIEYRDRYGNMVGTRTIEKKTRVDQYKVEVGKVYHVETTMVADLAKHPVGEAFDIDGKDCESCDIKVTRVFEKPVFITIPLPFGYKMDIPTRKTIRSIEGVDIKTGKMVQGSIGDAGVWTVYKRTTDQPITPVKKIVKA